MFDPVINHLEVHCRMLRVFNPKTGDDIVTIDEFINNEYVMAWFENLSDPFGNVISIDGAFWSPVGFLSRRI